MSGVAASAVGRDDVLEAAKGDEIAFARLVSAHHAEMARIAFAIAGDRQVAEDAVQSAWVVAWQRLGSLRQPERVRQWLIAIAVNEARQVLRKRRRARVTEIDLRQRGPDTSDPAVGIGRLDLAAALRRLSVDDRALLALRYVSGFDAGEIGAATGRSASGTRTRLSRLTAQLREELVK